MILSRIENMPRTARKGGAVRLPEETINLLRKLAKNLDKTQPWILERLLIMADTHDLLNEGWQDRLTAALEKGMWHLENQKHFENQGACAGLRAADRKWKCVQGRPNKTPMIRILAEDYDEACGLCVGCMVTQEPILKNYELQEKIQQLQKTLNAQGSVTFKAPVCNRGAVLTADGTEFRGCERGTGRTHKTVSIKTWCKVFENRSPCYSYAEIPIVADGESQLDIGR